MIDPHALTITLCHQPDLCPAVVRRNVNLILAEHYHGGQVKLPFFGTEVSLALLVSEFVEGRFVQSRSQSYISHGIGISGPPICLNAPPEITLLRLT
jgi:hypothetical protein